MSSAVVDPTRSAPPGLRSTLVGRRIPASAPYLSAGAGIVLALIGKLALGWTGWWTTFFTAVALFLIVLTGWSFRVEGRRRAKDRFATTLIYGCFVAAVVPLVLILVYMAQRGIPGLVHGFANSDPAAPGSRTLLVGALIGTVEQILLAGVIAIPIGIFTAIYLVEYGRGALARGVTFFVDVMTGVPSIVAGLFVYTFLLLGTGSRPFGFAGSLALCILMIPVVVRSSEEMLRLVPRDLRDASSALGVPKWRTTVKIVLPTALSGLITSGLLAVARIAGETAPLILLVGYSPYLNWNPFSGDQASLPMLVWDQLGKRTGGQGSAELAFGAALLLVLFILVLNVVARLLANRAKPKSR